MGTIREAAVAGMFYPAEPKALHRMIDDYLVQAQRYSGPVPKAIIAPHAGYIYSGPVAANAYACLEPARERIHRVVLLGPSHRVPFSGLAYCGAQQFDTPLGAIPVDQSALSKIQHLPQVKQLDAAHTQEHSLEVHLPFLQTVLDSFSIVPLVIGDAQPEQIEQVLELLWGGEETLIVVSSDLSHYQNYETAQQMDQLTSQAIVSLKPEDIHFEQACGRNPVNGLLVSARRHGLHVEILDQRNSGDTAGPKDQVVGYGAYIFH